MTAAEPFSLSIPVLMQQISFFTKSVISDSISVPLRLLSVIQANQNLKDIPKHDRSSLTVEDIGEELDESCSVSDCWPTDPHPRTLSIIFTCKPFGKY
jgi:hypothetical protein